MQRNVQRAGNVKCTAFTRHVDAQPGVAARAWLAAVALAASLLGGGSPAAADIELGHTGQTGRHRLADMYDSPGAVCDIVLPSAQSLGETWLRVNPPVMFARDRTPALDEQHVGWRAVVSALEERTGAWHVVRRGETTRALASDDLATYFDGQGWLAEFPVARGTYSVTVEMLWYDPHDADRVVATATHAIEHYMVVLRYNSETMRGRTSSVCRSPR